MKADKLVTRTLRILTSKKARKGISSIIGAIIFLLIMVSTLEVALYIVQQQAGIGVRSAEYLQSINEVPQIYEVYHEGVTELEATQPVLITHIILPNGEMLNTSILLQGAMSILNITQGKPWAIIVTSRGTWYNVTPIKLPGLIWDNPIPSNVSGEPWFPWALAINVSNTTYSTGWAALLGISELNLTKTPLPCPVIVDNDNFYEGVTGKEVVLYLDNDSGWINITYYAPPHYVQVESPYWEYYCDAKPPDGTFTSFLGEQYSYPFNNPYFYILVTTNPYIKDWTPLWNSSIYLEYVGTNGAVFGALQYYESTAPICHPGGGINFTYYYINASIGIYIPSMDESGLQYAYYTFIPFVDFEVTALTACVPAVVNFTYSSSLLPSVTVKIENATQVWSPYSWIVAPLSLSPPTGNIENPYSSASPYLYENFPAHNYLVFPAYPIYPGPPSWAVQFRSFSAAYNGTKTLIWPFYNIKPNALEQDVLGQGPPYAPVTLLDCHDDPIMVYRLDINLNNDIILNYGYNEITGQWILLSNISIVTVNGIPMTANYIKTLPVYITIPYGTYLLSINETL